jgi:hypothetical protein
MSYYHVQAYIGPVALFPNDASLSNEGRYFSDEGALQTFIELLQRQSMIETIAIKKSTPAFEGDTRGTRRLVETDHSMLVLRRAPEGWDVFDGEAVEALLAAKA